VSRRGGLASVRPCQRSQPLKTPLEIPMGRPFRVEFVRGVRPINPLDSRHHPTPAEDVVWIERRMGVTRLDRKGGHGESR
jgi:hypothetical protein